MGSLISLLLRKSGWARTAAEEAHGHNLNGKVAIVTGATSGIGFETARVLAAAGARVIIACHDVAQGERARERMLPLPPQGGQILVRHLDLASFRSIRGFADAVSAEADGRLDFLVLNAAVMGVPLEHTREGFESHFGVNYLGHRHLAQLLLPRMLHQPSPCRLVVVTCALSKVRSALDLRDLGFRYRKYEWWVAYNQSKQALWLWAKELSARLKGSKVGVFAADPGRTATRLTRNLGPIQAILYALQSVFVKTAQQGAASVVFSCLNERIGASSGAYVRNCRVVRKAGGTKDKREGLWDTSEEMIANAKLDSWQAQGDRVELAFVQTLSRGLAPLLEMVGMHRSKGHRSR